MDQSCKTSQDVQHLTSAIRHVHLRQRFRIVALHQRQAHGVLVRLHQPHEGSKILADCHLMP